MSKFGSLNLSSVGHTVQLAGAVYAGDGKLFLCMLPDDPGTVFPASVDGPVLFMEGWGDKQEHLEVEVLSMGVGEWQEFLLQADVLATEVTDPSDPLKKAVVRKSQRQIEQGVSWNVFRRDGYACRYCGRDDVPLTVDHLILWEEGGPSTEANLVSACRKCNKTRGRTQYADWLVHPFYVRASQALSVAQREANRGLAQELTSVQRADRVRSR